MINNAGGSRYETKLVTEPIIYSRKTGSILNAIVLGDTDRYGDPTGRSRDGRRLTPVPAQQLYAFAWQDDQLLRTRLTGRHSLGNGRRCESALHSRRAFMSDLSTQVTGAIEETLQYPPPPSFDGHRRTTRNLPELRARNPIERRTHRLRAFRQYTRRVRGMSGL